MLVSIVWWLAAAIDVLALTSWAVLAGWWHRRTPHDKLRSDGRLQLRQFETAGHWYEQKLYIKAWKDRLPETGGRAGGMSKRRLPGCSAADLERFAAECRRGERTHWTIVAGTPPLVLWNPFGLFLIVAGAGVAGNAPFVAVLRYNRARIASIVQRDATRAAGSLTVVPVPQP